MIPHSKPLIDEDDVQAPADVIRSGLVATGTIVRKFEEEFADYTELRFARAVSSGTNALHIALKSVGVGPTSEVILPSYVCASVLDAVKHTGAVPVFADVVQGGYLISPRDVQDRISKKTGAIIVPHLFGSPATIDDLLSYNIPIIEDCAQALGATYGQRPVGTNGTISAYSFGATKVITTGNGGMIATNNPELQERIQRLLKVDKRDEYTEAFSYDMTDFQAALGRSQLRKVPAFLARRAVIAGRYDAALSAVDVRPLAREAGDIFFRYLIPVSDIELAQDSLERQGVRAERPVYYPLHRYFSGPSLPATESAHKTYLSIPIYPAMSELDVQIVSNALQTIRKVMIV